MNWIEMINRDLLKEEEVKEKDSLFFLSQKPLNYIYIDTQNIHTKAVKLVATTLFNKILMHISVLSSQHFLN